MAAPVGFEVILLHPRSASPSEERVRALQEVAGVSRTEAQALLRATSPTLRRRLAPDQARALASELTRRGVSCTSRPMGSAGTSEVIEGGEAKLERFDVVPVLAEAQGPLLPGWAAALGMSAEALRSAMRQGRAIRRGLSERQALDEAASLRERELSCCARGAGQGVPERTTPAHHVRLLGEWSSTELPIALRACGLTGPAFSLEAHPPPRSAEEVGAARARLDLVREAIAGLHAQGRAPNAALARSVLATTQRAALRAEKG